MIIGLLMVLAAIAGATSVWLFMRGSRPAAAAAPATDAVSATDALPQAVERTPSVIAAAPMVQPTDPPPAGVAAPDPAASSGLSEWEIFGRLYERALGPLASQPPPERELKILSTDARRNFDDLVLDPRYTLRRPLLLPQLLRVVNDRGSNQHQLVKIIAKDPALAGNLLKMANSPLYRVRAKPVESLDRAVALLGSDGLHSLIAMTLAQPIFKLNEAAFPKFPQLVWDHTFRAAMATEAWAAAVDGDERFAAQLLAITLGLGAIVTFRIVTDRSHSLLGGKMIHPAVVVALLESQVPVVAEQIAASWGLSERVLAGLREQAPRAVGAPPREPSVLARALEFGRCLAALALLRGQDGISDEVVTASMLKLGPLPEGFDALWARLIEEERPERPRPGSRAGA